MLNLSNNRYKMESNIEKSKEWHIELFMPFFAFMFFLTTFMEINF